MDLIRRRPVLHLYIYGSCIFPTLSCNSHFRFSEFIRARNNVHALLGDVSEDRETMVEEVHHAAAASTVFPHPHSLFAAALATGLPLPTLASAHLYTPEHFHDRPLR